MYTIKRYIRIRRLPTEVSVGKLRLWTQLFVCSSAPAESLACHLVFVYIADQVRGPEVLGQHETTPDLDRNMHSAA